MKFGGNSWAIVTGAGLAALAMASFYAAIAQPVPRPRPDAEGLRGAVSADPIGELLQRVGRDGQPANIPVVIGVRLVEEAEHSRLEVELSDPVEAKLFTLTGPDRVVIDLPEVLWRQTSAARPSGRSAIKSYRYGLFRQGNSRFVVDLNSPVRASESRILPPESGSGYRLVVDLYPTTAQAFAASAGWPGDASPPTVSPVASFLPPPSGGKYVIVVDAGHGGVDPGTHGRSGMLEKDLVLAVAMRVRDALESTGRYTVRLTRDRDVFIPLRERVEIARAARGDLFISLHADSNEERDIRGASVYTLSEAASDREAAKLAEKENMSDAIAGIDLNDESAPVASILIDLAQRDTMNRSVRFAETLLASLPGATTIRPTSPHRSAGFAVLKAPDVPAALVELGYLTNVQDEREMAKESWRNQVAQAISRAVDRHFAAQNAPIASQAAAR
jgi:N-acetylmuramoyl-L-alanine amidase